MKYNKLVVLHWQNFDKRYSDLSAIPELIQKGIIVEYWDVSAISIPGYKVHSYPPPKGLIVRTILNKKHFINLLKSNDKCTAYLIHMTYCYNSFTCYRLLSKYKCDYIYCINGCLPDIKYDYQSKSSYYRSLSFKTFSNLLIQKIFNAIAKSPLISYANYVLATCREARNRNECKIGPETRWIDYNSCDYQQCINSSTSELSDFGEYFVFIDQNIPFHPDNKYQGLTINAREYFAAMNSLFDVIERKYKIRIIIAAHPSCYDKYLNGHYFGERIIIQGKTQELVKRSLGVIAHNSTATSFAILYNKPLLIVTTVDMLKVRKQFCRSCELYSKLLNCVYIKSENSIELPEILSVDKESYDAFKYQYLTNKDSESISNGQILFNLLQGNNND